MKIGTAQLDNNVFLAPMAGVSDMPFRILCKEYGCGLVYSEMVSALGMHYGSKNTEKLLEIDDSEKPVAVQIFGNDPEIMAETAVKLCQYPIEIIDINMGCPVNKIIKNNEGSALMRDPKLAEQIIKAVVIASSKPVTVKFRKGWDEKSVNAPEFAKMAENAGASAVAVHGRTRVQMYSGKADWDIIKNVKQAVKIPVIGNGDVVDGMSAKKMFEYTECDAIMVGRAAHGNPWIFEEINCYLNGEDYLPPTSEQKVQTIIRQIKMLKDLKGEKCAVNEMRSHIACYIKGMHDAARVRDKIFRLNSLDEVIKVLKELV